MEMSSTCLQQIFLLACLACRITSSFMPNIGTIIPQSPTVEIGKEFTATCVLYEAAHTTADNIYWTCNDRVPEEQYTKINDSAISVTITITNETCKWLICHKKSSDPLFDQSNHIHGILLTKGYPPEKPDNLSCMAVQDGQKISPHVECTWRPGEREAGLSTNYTLFSRDCSKDINISAQRKVKTNPPSDVQISSENNFPRSLLILWKRPINEHYFKLKYNIRFCPVDSGNWTEMGMLRKVTHLKRQPGQDKVKKVPLNDINSDQESFRLQSLKLFTEYVVQVRCIRKEGGGYWSDWSVNTTSWTPEDNPSSEPDLWRVVMPIQGKSARLVQVMCKRLLKPNGRIKSYDIKIQDGDWMNVTIIGPELDTNLLQQFELPDETEARVEVQAWNSVGHSPHASLVIPKLKHELPQSAMEIWTGREWVENSKRPLAIRGNLEKFKLYNISVYPIFSGMIGKPLTQAAYLEQGAPLVGPTVRLKQNGKNDVVLEWSKIPLDQQRGFITNYTIFYTTGVQEHSINVPPDTYSYTVKNLVGNSKYVIKVMASTLTGSTNSSDYTFNTLQHDFWEVEAIVVAVCIGFLFVVVFTVCMCLYRMDRIKKMIWPSVPDPSNSSIVNWSPDFQSKADTPKESALCDVSVVKVDVFDGRSLSGEDKAGLPLSKDKYLSEEHSSGIGGSSCMSSPRQSVSDSDEGGDSGQTTASTVQYSSVVVSSGYKGQTPCQTPQVGSSQAPSFARSESTQPLLDGEEQLEGQEGSGQSQQRYLRNPYFRRSPGRREGREAGGVWNLMAMVWLCCSSLHWRRGLSRPRPLMRVSPLTDNQTPPPVIFLSRAATGRSENVRW
ncbi:hypothetical protein UPYG_G00275580 [Umbra pygmaea]|uniref:Fibronectin type-III domain-containing protein n=1 Tax=Umbra pygmaea TaxID=75934 RepID=A0ABD0WQW6_UMBPY